MKGHFVMLHGMTGTAEKMRPLAEQFCPKGWGLVVLDAPFTHPREGLAWWVRDAPPTESLDRETIEQLEVSVASVRSNLPPSGPLIVGGFSQGAAVAQELLMSDVADRIIGVVVLGSKAARPLLLYEHLCNLPPQAMYSMHGETDHIVPSEQADECARVYAEAGWNVTEVRHHKGHMVDQSKAETLHGWLADVVARLD